MRQRRYTSLILLIALLAFSGAVCINPLGFDADAQSFWVDAESDSLGDGEDLCDAFALCSSPNPQQFVFRHHTKLSRFIAHFPHSQLPIRAPPHA